MYAILNCAATPTSHVRFAATTQPPRRAPAAHPLIAMVENTLDAG
jgi:hypothetical protein